MNGKMKYFIVSCVAVLFFASLSFAGAELTEGLLRDGHVIRSVQGEVIRVAEGGAFMFKPSVDVNDLASVVKAATEIQLLPSLMLEKLVSDLASRSENTYLITARVTQYKGQNYLFPTYFRSVIVMPEEPVQEEPKEESKKEPVEPIQPAEEPKVEKPESEQQEEPSKPAVVDANIPLGIPQEVLDRINSKKVVRTKLPPKPIEPVEPIKPEPKDDKEKQIVKPTERAKSPTEPSLEVDSAMAGRMAYLKQLDNGNFAFVLDGYGLSAKRVTLNLLPCQALELTEEKCTRSPEKMRFKIAGIKTTYKGKDYLLLQRAAPTYSHGNFRAFIPQ